MEKIKRFLDQNRKPIIVVWGLFTIFLFYHLLILLPPPLETASSLPGIKEVSVADNLRPWNTKLKSIETIKARWGIYESDEAAYSLNIKGWAFSEISKDIINDSIYVVLESSTKKRWTTTTSRFSTRDVMGYFGGNESLSEVGFAASISKTGLQNGVYRIGLLFKNENFSSLCWIDKSMTVQRPVDLVKATRPSNQALPLQFSIYSIAYGENITKIECWAFPTSGPCLTCKAYLTLSDPNSFSTSESIIVPKQDVADYFKNPALVNSGIQSIIKSNSLPRGFYKLGILLKDTVSKKEYFSETDKLVHMGWEEFITPEKNANKEMALDSINASIDAIVEGKDYIKVDGWAFINKVSSDSTAIFFALQSPDSLFSYPATPVLRPDIQKYFMLTYNLDWSGFSVKFKKNSVKSGDYNLAIVMLNKKTGRKSIRLLRRVIEI